MSQEPDLTEQGTTPTEEERNRRSGRDIPGGTGIVSDEDVNAISDANKDTKRETGVDHSTDVEDRNTPEESGAIQDQNDTTSSVAHIKE